MSYRVGTPNYNLPQTEGNDLRDWFDTNEPFRRVDADLHSAKQGVESQGATIEAMQIDIGNNTQGLADANGEIADIKVKQATDEENIAQNGQAISQLGSKVDALDTDLAEMIEVTEEESATASVQHNVGDYFRYNDNLWITTVLIRVGDEIVPNVNCETTDVMTRVYNLEHSGGGAVDASAVTFDNTGTDLISTNVEAVTKEVNTKVNGAITAVGDVSNDMGGLMFRDNDGQAQYSLDDGTTWANFKNPVGTKSITANGTYDVTDYASALVDVTTIPNVTLETFEADSGVHTYTYTYDPTKIYVAITFEHVEWQSRCKIYYNGALLRDYVRRSDKPSDAPLSLSVSGGTVTVTANGTVTYMMVFKTT